MVRILELEAYAKKNNIPIMMPDGIEFLLTYIKENSIKTILEVGTAIGYSAIRMALVDKDIYITTIERDEQRYLEAVKNIKEFGLEDRINILYQDAFDVELTSTYDLIFIDAAKSQYVKFFEKFQHYLTLNGTILSDNLNFHGYTQQPIHEITSKNIRGIARKLQNYIQFLQENKDFTTEFLEIGDGIAVSKKN